MSERQRPNRDDDYENIENIERSPETDSTWNTIGGTVDIEDLADDEELKNLLVEPTVDEFDMLDENERRARG
jgi:hypothetical protein